MFLDHGTVQQLTALGGIKSILLEGLYSRLTEFKLCIQSWNSLALSIAHVVKSSKISEFTTA